MKTALCIVSILIALHWRVKHQVMKMGKLRYSSVHSYPWHYMEVSSKLHSLATLPPSNQLIKHWMGPQVGLDMVPKSSICPYWEMKPEYMIVHSAAYSLYWLSYHQLNFYNLYQSSVIKNDNNKIGKWISLNYTYFSQVFFVFLHT